MKTQKWIVWCKDPEKDFWEDYGEGAMTERTARRIVKECHADRFTRWKFKCLPAEVDAETPSKLFEPKSV